MINIKTNKCSYGGGGQYYKLKDPLFIKGSIFGLIVGVIITCCIAYASTSTPSNDVYYDNSNSTLSATTVQEALDELYDKANKKSLLYEIVKDAKLDTDIDFSKVSSDTNGKGMYIVSSTAVNTTPIYYYRGAVTDNNVLFANFCWKIVRTTETGGVKLIYNGIPMHSKSTTISENDYIVEDQRNFSFDSNTNMWRGTDESNIDFYVSTSENYYLNYIYDSEVLVSEISDKNGKFSYYLDYSTEEQSIYLGYLESGDLISIYSEGGDLSFSLSIPDENSNLSCNNTGLSSQLSSTSVFNSSDNKNAYVGYMYGTAGSSSYTSEHANTNNSTIKRAIDTWYKSNMTSYTDKLEDTVWCNDRSIYSGNGYGTSKTYYGAYGRLYTNKAPSLACTNANDRFTVSSDNGNGDLDYPVALLTTDEIAYAGAVYNISNSTYYLYTGSYWWSLSPSYFSGSYAFVWNVYSNGAIGSYYAYFSTGVRPAVSLKPGTTYTSGTGTTADPYVIS